MLIPDLSNGCLPQKILEEHMKFTVPHRGQNSCTCLFSIIVIPKRNDTAGKNLIVLNWWLFLNGNIAAFLWGTEWPSMRKNIIIYMKFISLLSQYEHIEFPSYWNRNIFCDNSNEICFSPRKWKLWNSYSRQPNIFTYPLIPFVAIITKAILVKLHIEEIPSSRPIPSLL